MPSHDVLIIGAGLAGQRAALAAAQAGASVAVMSKVHPVRSHSEAAAGGINAAISVADDWRSHAYDTVKGSDFLGDQDAIEVMCAEAPHEVMHLEHIGVTFHRNDEGELDLRAYGGASLKRSAYVADSAGEAMLHVLYEQLMRHHETVDLYEEWFTTCLMLGEGGRCSGVIARDVRSGRLQAFAAKNVILACGGAGQGYEPTTNRLLVPGDGIAPGQHYIMGGVKTDVEGRTSIEGLYAAGEVACVSVHGGNRLGANSLLDTLIFGRRAGEHAAARASAMAMPSLDSKPQLRR